MIKLDKGKVTLNTELPVFNRAQRRALAKYIRHKAAPLRKLQRQQQRATCQYCNLPYLGVHIAGFLQCQCKVRPHGISALS